MSDLWGSSALTCIIRISVTLDGLFLVVGLAAMALLPAAATETGQFARHGLKTETTGSTALIYRRVIDKKTYVVGNKDEGRARCLPARRRPTDGDVPQARFYRGLNRRGA